MKVMVTGGAGFIGSELVRQLKGQCQVSVLDNLSTGKRENVPVGVQFYQGDLVDSHFVLQTVGKERPEIIFHLGAQVSVLSSAKNPQADAAANVIGTINILEAAVKYNIKKIIYASTAAVYGTPQYLPLDEKHPIRPLSGYGVSKFSSELYLQLYYRVHGLQHTILRFANVYGPGQLAANSGIISILINCLRLGTAVCIFGDGEQTRDFLYVKDVAAAAAAAIKHGDNMTLNIGTNTAVSVNTLLHIVGSIWGRPVNTVYTAERVQDIRHSVLDPAKGINALAWNPIYSLEQGLQETVYAAQSGELSKGRISEPITG